jgi:membrane protein CcdC involved in cytochrome C biogenesis
MNPLVFLGGAFVVFAISLLLAFLDWALIQCIYDSIKDGEWTESFFYFLGFCMITGFLIFLLGTLLG